MVWSPCPPLPSCGASANALIWSTVHNCNAENVPQCPYFLFKGFYKDKYYKADFAQLSLISAQLIYLPDAPLTKPIH